MVNRDLLRGDRTEQLKIFLLTVKLDPLLDQIL
jgi:hypothetical protein